MVVPMGFTPSPTSQTLLPASLQFLARPFDEGTLIRAAYAYEQATQNRRYHPSADVFALSLLGLSSLTFQSTAFNPLP